MWANHCRTAGVRIFADNYTRRFLVKLVQDSGQCVTRGSQLAEGYNTHTSTPIYGIRISRKPRRGQEKTGRSAGLRKQIGHDGLPAVA